MGTTMTDDIALNYSKFTSDNDLTMDDFIVFQDVDIEHLSMMQRYETLKSKTYTTSDEKLEMSMLLTELEEYMPTSDTWNKLCACIRTMQMFFRDGIVVFVKQKQDEFEALLGNYDYKGEYDNTINYVFGNLIRYNGFGFVCLKACVGQYPNVDSDTDYWIRFTIKGDKGDPSLNVSCKGNYSSATTYNIGDACIYNGILYYAIVNNTLNVLPTVTSNWATMEHVMITGVEPLDKNVIWVDSGNNYVIKTYNTVTTTWTSQTLNGKTASGTLTTIEQTNLVNAINELNANKSNANVTPIKDGTVQTGLNAEMVGSKHSTDFASATNSFNAGTTNIDTYNPNQNWSARSGQTNGGTRPNISQYSTVLNVGADNNSNFQIAGTYDGTNKLAYRTRHDTDGVYGSWKRILNEDDYNTLFQSATNVKSKVANAINNKGGSANSSMTGDQLASAIGNIQTAPVTGTGYKPGSADLTTISTIVNLGFRPSLIILEETNVTFNGNTSSKRLFVRCSDYHFCLNNYPTTSTAQYYLLNDGSNFAVIPTDTGFTYMNKLVGYNQTADVTFKYIAYH